MKYLTVSVLSLAAVFAQAQPAQAPISPAAQEFIKKIGEMPGDKVLATFEDGTKFTASDLQQILRRNPGAAQQFAAGNRKRMVEEYGLMVHMSKVAEKEKLNEKSPFKEQLELAKMQILFNAALNDYVMRAEITDQDIQHFYDNNKPRFTQVRVKAIYIPFTSSGGGAKYLTEPEAKKKADKVVADARGGADFVKLVKENSEDATSKEKDGDFATIRQSDNIPENIRSVIFSLKQGEVSEPVRQPNGFYIFRAEQVGLRPLAEVKNDLVQEIQNSKLDQYVKSQMASLKIKYEDEELFNTPAPAAAPKAPSLNLPKGK